MALHVWVAVDVCADALHYHSVDSWNHLDEAADLVVALYLHSRPTPSGRGWGRVFGCVVVELGYYQAAVGVIGDGSDDDDDDDGHFPVRLGCSVGTASTWDDLLLQVCCLPARCGEGVGLWTPPPQAPLCDSWLLL